MSQWNKAGGENPVRAAVRFPLQLALRLETAEGTIDATTINVSAAGLLFRADRLPQVGSRIVFTMEMPSAVMGADHDVNVHCVGRIVRHYSTNGALTAAAVIDEYFLKV
jgi:porphobilinogen deaminase